MLEHIETVLYRLADATVDAVTGVVTWTRPQRQGNRVGTGSGSVHLQSPRGHTQGTCRFLQTNETDIII